jgi:hypothetical protein
MAKITFRIKKGQVSVDVDGVKGTSCKDITEAFTEALGMTTSVQDKPEVYDQIDDLEAVLYESDE